MAQVPIGASVATYQLQHVAVQRPMAVTCGHDLQGWTGSFVEAADRLMEDFGETMMNALDSQIALTGVSLFIGNAGDPSGSLNSTLAPIQGTAEWTSPVVNTAVLVDKVTGSIGRAGKGRMFLPGAVPEGQVAENGVVDANVLGQLQDYLDDWYTALQAEGAEGNGPLPPVVIGSPGGQPASFAFDVTGFRAQNVVATQRRRLRR